ncbi:MAG: toprim domain-containing protein [Gammaproteobacteria bacterium]|nr:toprim domain-containing protein [Gammaproteobacteria bacterium]
MDTGAQTLFARAVESVHNAGAGERNNRVFKSACTAGGLIAAARLDDSEARTALLSAAIGIGLEKAEAETAIKSGIQSGQQKPIHSTQNGQIGRFEPAPTPPPKPKGNPGAIWQAGVSATGTLAERYLVERHAWPPAAVDGYKPIPDSVRWCDKAHWPTHAGFRIPQNAAGAILCRYEGVGGAGRAIQCDALDSTGKRLERRWRRCAGAKAGAWFTAGRGGSPVVLVEGEIDALAAQWLLPGCEARACGGTAGLASGAALPTDGRPAEVWPDGDLAGDKAAQSLSDRARIRYLPNGDPADTLAKRIRVDSAMVDLLDAWRQLINEQELANGKS